MEIYFTKNNYKLGLSKGILTKLGEALYIHKHLQKKAEEAKKSVDYLKDAGLFHVQNN